MKKIFPNHKRSGGEEPLLLAVCANERLERELSAVGKLSAEGITEISKETFGEAFRHRRKRNNTLQMASNVRPLILVAAKFGESSVCRMKAKLKN